MKRKRFSSAFTLIELVIVITILAILAAVAIPAFQNLTGRAKDAGVQGAVGAMRSAVATYRSNEIAENRPANYPTLASMQDQADTASSAGNPKAMEQGNTPDNPWCSTAVTQCAAAADKDKVTSGALSTRAIIVAAGDGAWRYEPSNGLIYANTSASSTGTLENTY